MQIAELIIAAHSPRVPSRTRRARSDLVRRHRRLVITWRAVLEKKKRFTEFAIRTLKGGLTSPEELSTREPQHCTTAIERTKVIQGFMITRSVGFSDT